MYSQPILIFGHSNVEQAFHSVSAARPVSDVIYNLHLQKPAAIRWWGVWAGLKLALTGGILCRPATEQAG
jgi:hypothetical protein